MFDFAENTFGNERNSVAETDFDISRGMIGFDRETDAYTCMAEVGIFLKNPKL